MAGLVECVPNLSEGRRPEVIDRLAAVVSAASGVRLLHRTSDADHHRSVLTFVGDAAAVGAAALALVDAAYREIDMRAHHGAHPRFGAVDVLPFVPLAGSTMHECIALAHRVGREIAAQHGVPVYFYARAALRPDRVRLPDVRKPEYEGLAALIGGSHAPDAGPALVHPTAGAIAVGARPPLIAFNVELDTDDLALARRIAREIRESSGGLPAVQAMGVLLTEPARAQVSCNLLDHRATSLGALFQAIESRAAAAGVRVLRSELIGLMPLEAAADVAAAALRLDRLGPDQLIEGHLLP